MAPPSPGSGVDGGAGAAAAAPWTCPMHPEIVRDGPGSCPICGMALEPTTVTAEEPENPELADMSRRFWVSAALTAAAGRCRAWREMLPFAWAHAPCEPGAPVDRARAGDAGRALGRAGRSSCGRWARSSTRSLNMFTLIALGVGRGLRLQRRRDAAARALSARVPRARRRSRRLLRGGGGHHHAGAARAGAGAARAQPDRRAPSGRCSAWRRRRRAGSRDDGARRTCRSSEVRPATGCACGRARRCRSTAWCSRARAPSTSRWSPASRSRSRRQPGDRVIGAHRQRHRRAA